MGPTSIRLLVSLAFAVAFQASCVPKQVSELDDRKIADLMSRNQDSVDRCYREALKANPKLPSGTVSIKVDRNPEGQLISPRLMDGFAGSEPLFQCLISEVKNWKLTDYYSRGSIEFTWEFKKIN